MSGFELAPVDGGCCPVALPPGETVIGRGALLGITDKRVSRKHAILKVAGNQLSIKPVHMNPCFYQPIENGQQLPLDIDKWHRLSPGDNFSLLVDKYVFRVIFTPSVVESLPSRENCSLSVEDVANQTSSALQPTKMSCREPSEQQTIFSGKSQLLEVQSRLEKAAEIPKKFSTSLAENEESRPAQRKRMLPAWMLQENLMAQNPSNPVPGRGNSEEISKHPGKKRKIIESKDTALAMQDIQKISSEPVVEKMQKNESKTVPQIAESSMGQCNHQLENEELDLNSDGQACQPTETDTSNIRKNKLENISSKAEQVDQDKPSQPSLHHGEIQELTLNQGTEADISNLTESQNVPQSSYVTRHQRTACQYGRGCYRKNPIHFQEFSHPGDSDYHVTDALTQTDTDNRPECPYGTDCYRKNPQHKLEYKHTAPPESERRQMRPKVIKKGRSGFLEDSDNDGEPNEYNLNDSFIDDDDDDDDEEEEECDPTDEDSDWEPDFQDKDNEDIGTLLKEAQSFVKTKK